MFRIALDQRLNQCCLSYLIELLDSEDRQERIPYTWRSHDSYDDGRSLLWQSVNQRDM